MSLTQKTKVLLNWDWKNEIISIPLFFETGTYPTTCFTTRLRYLERLPSLSPCEFSHTVEGCMCRPFLQFYYDNSSSAILYDNLNFWGPLTSYPSIWILFNQYFLYSIFPHRQLTLWFLNSIPVTVMLPTKVSKSQSSSIKVVVLQYLHRT